MILDFHFVSVDIHEAMFYQIMAPRCILSLWSKFRGFEWDYFWWSNDKIWNAVKARNLQYREAAPCLESLVERVSTLKPGQSCIRYEHRHITPRVRHRMVLVNVEHVHSSAYPRRRRNRNQACKNNHITKDRPRRSQTNNYRLQFRSQGCHQSEYETNYSRPNINHLEQESAMWIYVHNFQSVCIHENDHCCHQLIKCSVPIWALGLKFDIKDSVFAVLSLQWSKWKILFILKSKLK